MNDPHEGGVIGRKHAMSTTTEQKKKNGKTPPAQVGGQCIGDHSRCPFPVVAKERCAAHYRRHNRGGDDAEPVHQHRGELVSLSLRITQEASEELEKAGGGYRVGAEVIEAWAKEQSTRTSGTNDAEEVLNLRAEVAALKAKLKGLKTRS